jgi:hypothetical protein
VQQQQQQQQQPVRQAQNASFDERLEIQQEGQLPPALWNT